MMRIVWLLLSYLRTRRLRFANRAALDAYQQRQLATFLPRLCASSPWFACLRELPFEQWPRMNKALMMANFDAMNTAGLQLDAVMATALAAEQSRDFTPAIGDITVGLSSGTSAQRGVFAVSAKEKATWAGVMLAKALPDGLLSGERVALFLRANSNLYTAVRTPWLTFAFYDLFDPFSQLLTKLAIYQPTVIVAPAQVLRQIAQAVIDGQVALAPKRVISVAEVLEQQDRALIVQAFGAVHEIYQATEGFLASTCGHGVLHMNEEYVHVEPDWLDAEQQRFTPVITDFSRMTQPVVRYRLDDVLVARREACPCGRPTRALSHIEGRCDDQLALRARDGAIVPLFSDLLSRALAQVLPASGDYRLVQTGPMALSLFAVLAEEQLATIRDHLASTMHRLGVDTAAIAWTLRHELPAFDPTAKRRRIVRLRWEASA
jgi:putative adenylate-forming enzyme